MNAKVSPLPRPSLDGPFYAVHELDHDRLWRAQQAIDLLSLLGGEQPSPIDPTHLAAVAEYVAEDMRAILDRVVRMDAGRPVSGDGKR